MCWNPLTCPLITVDIWLVFNWYVPLVKGRSQWVEWCIHVLYSRVFLTEAVQYGLGKLPYKIQTFITRIFLNMWENNFNQNYGTRFGFKVIAVKNVCVVVLVLCHLKHNRTSWDFRVLDCLLCVVLDMFLFQAK